MLYMHDVWTHMYALEKVSTWKESENVLKKTEKKKKKKDEIWQSLSLIHVNSRLTRSS